MQSKKVIDARKVLGVKQHDGRCLEGVGKLVISPGMAAALSRGALELIPYCQLRTELTPREWSEG